jgi:hypothetical protein
MLIPQPTTCVTPYQPQYPERESCGVLASVWVSPLPLFLSISISVFYLVKLDGIVHSEALCCESSRHMLDLG